MSPTFIIFGHKGLLGKNIKSEIYRKFPTAEIIEISRSTKVSIFEPTVLQNITSPIIAFYCHGPTDPRLSEEIHQKFHVTLPGLWYEKLAITGRLNKFVTLGSVHETRPLSSGNNYLTSKNNWLRHLGELGDKTLHFQLHTVYGEPFSPHSFLGELLQSICSGRDFEMSAGNQLREYHHVEDIVQRVVSVATLPESLANKVITLSHGHTISLRDLAQGIFDKVRPDIKLKVGALQSHRSEIVERLWEVTPEPFTPPWREPIESISKIILKRVNELK